MPDHRLAAHITSSLCLLLGAAACATADPPSRSPDADTDAVSAVFRHLFANNVSGLGSNAAAYCIGIGGRPALQDPSAELLASLGDIRPAVRPVSACRVDARVADSSGQPALLFNVRPLRCEGAQSCLFQGGYYEANLSASSGTYRARRENGRWRVEPVGPQAVS